MTDQGIAFTSTSSNAIFATEISVCAVAGGLGNFWGALDLLMTVNYF